jgi:type II secretory ATPase GspE/PulE/Tfp pilus assembly ATPase PilB-like protein
VVVADPQPVQLQDAFREASGARRLRLVVVPQSHLPPAEDAATAEVAVEETNAEVAHLRVMMQDTFLVRYTADIIERVISVGASHIHIARFDEGGIDSVARRAGGWTAPSAGIPIPRQALPGVISRLLLPASCNISQHRLPQSGKTPWPKAARLRYDPRIETSLDARGEHAEDIAQ